MSAVPTTAEPFDPSLGSFLFHKAFAQLATGLRWMFWGLVLQLVGGGAGLACLPFLRGGGGVPAVVLTVMPAVLMLFGTGGMVLVWGEHKCLHLTLPLGMTHLLPGRNLLRTAYWCLVGGFLLRFARAWIPRGPLRMLTVPLELASLFLLLLFLRKIAGVIMRNDLRRFIDLIFALSVAAVSSVIAIVAMQRLEAKPGPIVALPLVALAAVFVISVPICYAVLLWRMGTAARGFAEFLAHDDGDELADAASDQTSESQFADRPALQR
jgi:hypothetical protein